jgi:uncharacterized protein VirK/YbjX
MPAVISDPNADFLTDADRGWRRASTFWHYLQSRYKVWGIPGIFGSCWRLAGVFLSYVSHQKVVAVLDAPQSRLFAGGYPRLAYRYTLPYLSTGFSWGTRRELLQTHYAFVNERLGGEFAARVVRGNMVVWSATLEGQKVAVSVDGLCPVTRHREGELTLRFELNGTPLYFLSFSIVRESTLRHAVGAQAGKSPHVFYVGRVQGAPGEMSAIREATSLLGQVAPPDVLMAALAGMADAMGVQTLVGVGSDISISSHTIKDSRSQFDYAQFWSRFGGRGLPGGHTCMTLPIEERLIEEIPSKHRKRTLTKRAFKAQVATLAAEAMAPMMRSR